MVPDVPVKEVGPELVPAPQLTGAMEGVGAGPCPCTSVHGLKPVRNVQECKSARVHLLQVLSHLRLHSLERHLATRHHRSSRNNTQVYHIE